MNHRGEASRTRLTIIGDLSAQEDVMIHGRFEGRITLPDNHLSIDSSAAVKAKIVARSVTISGCLDGIIVASERVRVMTGARVAGHLMTPSLILEDGARFTGTVDPQRTQSAMQVARYRERLA